MLELELNFVCVHNSSGMTDSAMPVHSFFFLFL
uniref:Uncharacterized protein n=1 Tax=Arundo donax TaxID=35708 RepID=A0A0A8Y3L7_ARUDO